jgi:hypothetical protein
MEAADQAARMTRPPRQSGERVPRTSGQLLVPIMHRLATPQAPLLVDTDVIRERRIAPT